MTSLLIGPAQTLAQDEVYALPARLVHVTASAALEVSATEGGGFSALTNSATVGAYTSGGFVRCTTGTSVVRCKA